MVSLKGERDDLNTHVCVFRSCSALSGSIRIRSRACRRPNDKRPRAPLSPPGGEQRHEQQIQGERIRSIEDLTDADRLQEAREMLSKEIRDKGEDYNTLYLEAKILFKEKRFLDSLRKLERSLTLQGHRSAAHKLMALNAIALNRMDIAESNLKTAAQLEPDDYDVHYRLGIIYFLSDRFALCEGEMKRVLALRPTLMTAHDILGLALEELEQDEAAIQAYRKAIELTQQQNLRDEKAYLHLGEALFAHQSVPGKPAFSAEGRRPQSQIRRSFFSVGKSAEPPGRQSKSSIGFRAIRPE